MSLKKTSRGGLLARGIRNSNNSNYQRLQDNYDPSAPGRDRASRMSRRAESALGNVSQALERKNASSAAHPVEAPGPSTPLPNRGAGGVVPPSTSQRLPQNMSNFMSFVEAKHQGLDALDDSYTNSAMTDSEVKQRLLEEQFNYMGSPQEFVDQAAREGKAHLIRSELSNKPRMSESKAPPPGSISADMRAQQQQFQQMDQNSAAYRQQFQARMDAQRIPDSGPAPPMQPRTFAQEQFNQIASRSAVYNAPPPSGANSGPQVPGAAGASAAGAFRPVARQLDLEFSPDINAAGSAGGRMQQPAPVVQPLPLRPEVSSTVITFLADNPNGRRAAVQALEMDTSSAEYQQLVDQTTRKFVNAWGSVMNGMNVTSGDVRGALEPLLNPKDNPAAIATLAQHELAAKAAGSMGVKDGWHAPAGNYFKNLAKMAQEALKTGTKAAGSAFMKGANVEQSINVGARNALASLMGQAQTELKNQVSNLTLNDIAEFRRSVTAPLVANEGGGSAMAASKPPIEVEMGALAGSNGLAPSMQNVRGSSGGGYQPPTFNEGTGTVQPPTIAQTGPSTGAAALGAVSSVVGAGASASSLAGAAGGTAASTTAGVGAAAAGTVAAETVVEGVGLAAAVMPPVMVLGSLLGIAMAGIQLEQIITAPAKQREAERAMQAEAQRRNIDLDSSRALGALVQQQDRLNSSYNSSVVDTRERLIRTIDYEGGEKLNQQGYAEEIRMSQNIQARLAGQLAFGLPSFVESQRALNNQSTGAALSALDASRKSISQFQLKQAGILQNPNLTSNRPNQRVPVYNLRSRYELEKLLDIAVPANTGLQSWPLSEYDRFRLAAAPFNLTADMNVRKIQQPADSERAYTKYLADRIVSQPSILERFELNNPSISVLANRGAHVELELPPEDEMNRIMDVHLTTNMPADLPIVAEGRYRPGEAETSNSQWNHPRFQRAVMQRAQHAAETGASQPNHHPTGVAKNVEAAQVIGTAEAYPETNGVPVTQDVLIAQRVAEKTNVSTLDEVVDASHRIPAVESQLVQASVNPHLSEGKNNADLIDKQVREVERENDQMPLFKKANNQRASIYTRHLDDFASAYIPFGQIQPMPGNAYILEGQSVAEVSRLAINPPPHWKMLLGRLQGRFPMFGSADWRKLCNALKSITMNHSVPQPQGSAPFTVVNKPFSPPQSS